MASNATVETMFAYLKEIEKMASSLIDYYPKVPKQFAVHTYLGIGKTSNVFSVEDKGKKKYYALKVAKDEYKRTLLNEVAVLEVIDRKYQHHRHLQHLHWVGEVTFEGENKNAFMAYPVTDETLDDLVQYDIDHLGKALFDLHEAGFVHRDVSPNNIGHYSKKGERNILLRDFGFAVPIDNNDIYCGSIMTASNRILESLAEGSLVFTFKKIDDLESLWKTIFICLTNYKPLIPVGVVDLEEKARRVLNFWNDIGMERHQQYIQQIFDHAKEHHAYNFSEYGHLVFVPPGRAKEIDGKTKVPSPLSSPSKVSSSIPAHTSPPISSSSSSSSPAPE